MESLPPRGPTTFVRVAFGRVLAQTSIHGEQREMRIDGDDWPSFGWAADMRPAFADARARKLPLVLGTLVRATGLAPRPVGTQMAFVGPRASGYISGGCLEADVGNHASEVVREGTPRRLVYGQGSPWIDIRLLCGGSIEVLLERIDPDDAAVSDLLEHSRRRSAVFWKSDGTMRVAMIATVVENFRYDAEGYGLLYEPPWRLLVTGGDPIALAIAGLGASSGFEVTLNRPSGPMAPPPLPGVDYLRDRAHEAVKRLAPDRWTAVVAATHDDDVDDEVLAASLSFDPAYVGVLGSVSRAVDRERRLRARGVTDERIARIHAPIGTVRAGRSPWEIAVSVIAEIMELRENRRAFATRSAPVTASN